MWPVTILRLLLVAVLSLAAVSTATSASAVDIPDTRELTDFFDAAMARGLEANHVPGAVVSVVGGGRTISARGTAWPTARTGRRSTPRPRWCGSARSPSCSPGPQ